MKNKEQCGIAPFTFKKNYKHLPTLIVLYMISMSIVTFTEWIF